MLAWPLLLALAPAWPQTRAERTDYRETSHYSDVLQFLEGLEEAGAPVKLTFIGRTSEGRRIPLLIASRPLVTDPARARRQGRLVFYVQANIHAGEVEGKEAVLHLLRAWCQDPHSLLNKAVLLVNPIYNADGNEKFAPQARNRPGQNGPELVGVRANGQGLDLNRDYVKAESPEMRATLASVWTKWRPDVFMDLHTTDGTRHGYPLTWAPPLNPNMASGLYLFARDVMMPDIKAKLESEGLRTFDYGNDETIKGVRGWYSVSPQGRYSTNYAGLVNCIGVLSEALVYLPFRDRVKATERFVSAVVEYSVRHRDAILKLRAQADSQFASSARPNELGVRFDYAKRGVEGVWLERKPAKSGVPTDLEQVQLPVFDRFAPTASRPVPVAYTFPAKETRLAELLARHGIRIQFLAVPTQVTVNPVVADEVTVAQQPFQGHRLVTLKGHRAGKQPRVLAAGDFIVPCDQPLGALVQHILEPEGDDGAVAWGLVEPGKAGRESVVTPVESLPKGLKARLWKPSRG